MPSSPSAVSRSRIQYLDPAVLRLAHTIRGRNQEIAFTFRDDLNLGRRNAVLLEPRGNGFSTASGQPHVVGV